VVLHSFAPPRVQHWETLAKNEVEDRRGSERHDEETQQHQRDENLRVNAARHEIKHCGAAAEDQDDQHERPRQEDVLSHREHHGGDSDDDRDRDDCLHQRTSKSDVPLVHRFDLAEATRRCHGTPAYAMSTRPWPPRPSARLTRRRTTHCNRASVATERPERSGASCAQAPVTTTTEPVDPTELASTFKCTNTVDGKFENSGGAVDAGVMCPEGRVKYSVEVIDEEPGKWLESVSTAEFT